MRLSKHPKLITNNVIEKLAKEFGIDVDVIKTILSTYCTKIGIHKDETFRVFYPQWFFNQTGNLVQTFSEAEKIDSRRAMFCTAWGIGGIMGFDYSKAGYNDVTTMMIMFNDSEVEQLVGLLNVIKSRKRLYRAIVEKNWANISYNYNGIGYSNINAAQELFNNHKLITS